MEVKKKRSRAMQCVTFLLILLYGSTNMGGGAEDVPIFSGSNSAEAIKCHLGANSGHNSKLHQQSESGNFGNYRSKFNYSKLCQNF